MRLAFSILFFLLIQLANGQSISIDSMGFYLKQNGEKDFIQTFEKNISSVVLNTSRPNIDQLKGVVLLAIAYSAHSDTVNSGKLEDWVIHQNINTDQRHKILRFIFNLSGDYITRRALYNSIHQVGIAIAKSWEEPRAQFSFLENLLGLELFTKNAERKEQILLSMKVLSSGNDYLEMRTDFHFSEYFRSQSLDSCVFYFERFISAIQPRLGKPIPYFLQKTSWIQIADSSMLSSAYRGYAMYSTLQGELKKAGELMILADQLLPDTSIYDFRRVENQISLTYLYADFGNKEMALHYAEKAIALSEAKGYNKLRHGRVASAYARALFIGEDYQGAAVEYEKAFTSSLNGMNTVDPKRNALLLTINSIYAQDLQSASFWRKKAAAITCVPDDEILYLTATAEGLYGLLTGHTNQSIPLLKNAEQLAIVSNNTMWLCESQLHLYQLFKANGQLKEGLAYYENYVQLFDSLYRSGQEVALIEINGKYQKSLQDEKIVTLDAKNQVSTSRLLAQKRIVVGGSIALIVLSVLLAALYFFYKKLKESNALITRSNEEKNILLKEIHHRVKNNLQVISSLLKLQSGYIKDDAAIQAIAEGRSRVQSMALLHQNLYKEDNLTGVNMKVYFDTLIQGLFDTYNISPDRIKLHKQIESITLDVDTVIPLGLITNELISNALKHAFPGQRHGNLYVDLYESQNKLILKIKDDGEGISKQSDEEGFGTKLIHSLNQKLEAEMTITFDRGMEILIEIHDYKKAA